MIRVVVRIDTRIGLGDVKLDKRGPPAFVGDDRAYCGDQIIPAMVGGRAIDCPQNVVLATGQALERLKAGFGVACTGGVPIGDAKEISYGVAVAHPVDRMPVEYQRRRDALAGGGVGISHEADGGFRASLARQMRWMLAPTQAGPEPGVTGGEMHKSSLGGAFDQV